MVVEGEIVCVFVSVFEDGVMQVCICVEKEDGIEVFIGMVFVGYDNFFFEIEVCMVWFNLLEQFVILCDFEVGQKGVQLEQVLMGFDQYMGNFYFFMFNQKFVVIIENSFWYVEVIGEFLFWG